MLLELGRDSFDISTRALIVGALECIPGTTIDDLVTEADRFVAEGADCLEVGLGQCADDDLACVAVSVEALTSRFDLPIAVKTSRATIAEACFTAGASIGHDPGSFADPNYLCAAVDAGASVVACGATAAGVAERAAWAKAAGIPNQRIIVGGDIRAIAELAQLGFPAMLTGAHSDSNADRPDTDSDDTERGAHIVAVMAGARILRTQNVKGTRRLADTVAELLRRRGVAAPAAARRETS